MTPPAILRNDDPSAANLPVRLRLQAQLSARESPELNPSSLVVLLGMYRAMAVLDRNQTDELAPSGLNCAQFNVLTVLHRAATPLAMRQLSTMMAVQPTNLSGIVRTLRGRGLVKQVLNEADSRSLLVSITPEGERFLAKVLPVHWSRLEGIMSDLSEKERQTLVALLERLVHSIRVAEQSKTTDVPVTVSTPAAPTKRKAAARVPRPQTASKTLTPKAEAVPGTTKTKAVAKRDGKGAGSSARGARKTA
jgi:DNA-binding MarR family transcriptional regulator